MTTKESSQMKIVIRGEIHPINNTETVLIVIGNHPNDCFILDKKLLEKCEII